ncbi:MAG: carbonic anhydrase [Thermoanaerobaculia bacterium]
MKNSRRIFESALVAATATLLLGAACGRDPSAATKGAEKPAAAHEKHWGYEDGPDSAGPARWGDLVGDGPCKLGKAQSPIALVDSGEGAAAKEPALSFDYKPSKLSMINIGHTVQITYDRGSSVTEAGDSYPLAQFHFHAASEHTLDGKSFPLEVHLVHVDSAGKPALVVGVFVREGAENAALAAAFRALPGKKDESSEPAGATVDASGVLPASRTHFAYDGSLTTPPCTEGVRWRVMQEPIAMSAAQIEAFRSLPHLAHTNRSLQPLGARSVLLIAAP